MQGTGARELTIRRMGEEDLPQIAAIEREIFSAPWSENGFRESLRLENTVFLAAQENNLTDSADESCRDKRRTVVGYIGMYISLDEGEITNVAVAPWARRRGIGSQLVRRLVEEGRRAGVRRFVLEVRYSNIAAVELYHGQGFVEVGIRPGFYERPKEDARIMVKEI